MSSTSEVPEITDSGDDDLYPYTEDVTHSGIACKNSGMGESGDSVLYSSIDTIESGDEGLSLKSIEAYNNNSFSNSSSDNTDAGDDDLLPVINMVGSGKYCRYCGRGESGDRHLNSSTDAVDSGEDDLTFVSTMTDSGDMGQYSDKDSGDRGLSSVSDTIDSGESGLDSIKNTSEMKRSYSISEVTDSGDEDLYPIEYVTDSGKSCLNSGMGESGDSAMYSSTDAIESGEPGLCQKEKASDSICPISSELTESGDDGLLPAINITGSGKYCKYCGIGESGDKDLCSSIDFTDSGESDLNPLSFDNV
ncbi:uncharacterized protein LOC127915557 isoform X2 [Oncorhynchus keta]|uniref:uncharacterized protein LOC127915557 isoform X2 n=1 Tax=Oncorhynchus keta TaxID=8018 RepID=UPI00227B0EE2|nr:uncharacterized protein LOC127915557 isoform X2 [Oncorhynchus keta]